jgi:uncharacterized membrane protein (TIGR01666 family)
MVTDYFRTYKKFFSSHYLYEGVRITAGVVIPVVVASYFNQTAIGVTMALGSMATSMSDNAGPIHHRRNGMATTIILMCFVTLLVGVAVSSPWTEAVLLLILPFLFSIIGVYGTRPANVGTGVLLIMVLNIDKHLTLEMAVQNALLTAAGGVWYFFLSSFLHTLRPYKLAQQILGECINETANYLRCKALFYDEHVDYEAAYNQMLDLQVKVHAKQQAVRDILFKTRSVVNESTFTGRVLLMSFLDTVDLFERIMTSQQDYKLLHEKMDDTHLLESFRQTILLLADDLEGLAIAFQSGDASNPNEGSAENVKELGKKFQDTRNKLMGENNLEAFISLRHVLDSIRDLQSRIDTLHTYSTYDKKVLATSERNVEYNRYVSPSDFNVGLLLGNLNFKSNIFRHSLRVSIAMVLGFALSFVLPIEHDYWILLTIAVILKPAYSLTKARNFQRLSGTFIGGVIGVGILFLVKDSHALVLIIVICMVAAYSLMRTNYQLCVIFMTTYVLLAIHFLKPGNFNLLVQARLIDTAIGSVICIILIFLIPPVWEESQIVSLCIKAIQANAAYFKYMASAFTGNEIAQTEYKFLRKEIFVALANVSDAFQRMMNEPKRKQQQGEDIHQLVVANHVLASHIASLSAYRQNLAAGFSSPMYQPVIDSTLTTLLQASEILEHNKQLGKVSTEDLPTIKIRNQVETLLQQRVEELKQGATDTETRKKLSGLKTIVDQFEMIARTASDLRRVCGLLVEDIGKE